MNKAELISAIAMKTHVSQKQAELILNALVETVIDAVAGDDKVTLVGFGTFDKRDRQSRLGRNPKTGEEIIISATSVPGFTAGKIFKDRVASGSLNNVDALVA